MLTDVKETAIITDRVFRLLSIVPEYDEIDQRALQSAVKWMTDCEDNLLYLTTFIKRNNNHNYRYQYL